MPPLVDLVTLAPENGEWKNKYYNDFITKLIPYIMEIDGTSLEDPFVLSEAGQDLIDKGGDLDHIGSFGGNIATVSTVPHWERGITIVTGWSSGDVFVQGDGTTDDTAKIQRAINLTGYTGLDPRIVFFPPGTYLVSELDLTTSNLILQGSGPSTIIKAQASTKSLITVTGCSHCEIRDMVFDGNWATKTDIIGIEIEDADHLIIDSCEFRQIKGVGIKGSNVGAGNKNGTKITNCRFMEIADGGSPTTQNRGIYFADDCSWTNGAIEDCEFGGYNGTNDTNGLWLMSARGVNISGNIFVDLLNSVVLQRSANAEVMDEISVSNNLFLGQSLMKRGVFLHSLDGGGTSGVLDKVAIRGNLIDNPGVVAYSVGIELRTEDAATVTLTRNIAISGNVIRLGYATTYRYGIRFYSGTANDCSAANYGTIFGNVVTEPYFGIYLMAPHSGAPAANKTVGFAIGGNVVANTASSGTCGISLENEAITEVYDVTVIGNVAIGQVVPIQGNIVLNDISHNVMMP
mgnify:CR=1 FL=1